jgi:hypothetical protein
MAEAGNPSSAIHRPSSASAVTRFLVVELKRESMNKFIKILFVVIGIAMIPVAFLGGVYSTRKTAQRLIQSEADTLIYTSSVDAAKKYGELLLYARQGNTSNLIQRLEFSADASLLMASFSETNVMLKAFTKGPWSELRVDRSMHPRGRTPQDEARISSLLDELIREEPQL